MAFATTEFMTNAIDPRSKLNEAGRWMRSLVFTVERVLRLRPAISVASSLAISRPASAQNACEYIDAIDKHSERNCADGSPLNKRFLLRAAESKNAATAVNRGSHSSTAAGQFGSEFSGNILAGLRSECLRIYRRDQQA